jgi:hypothetical protein
MTYKTDDHGEYRTTYRWVDAWPGDGAVYVPGWCVCEVREYADGKVRVWTGKPTYTKDAYSAVVTLHAIYLHCAKELGK